MQKLTTDAWVTPGGRVSILSYHRDYLLLSQGVLSLVGGLRNDANALLVLNLISTKPNRSLIYRNNDYFN